MITNECQQLKDLLDVRRQELKDAHRFMGTVDAASESDVVEEVRGLNAEIFNLARSIAERASPHAYDQTTRSDAERVLADHNTLEAFFSFFKSTEVRGDAMLEVAMQVVATRFLAEIVSAWTGHAESDAAFSMAYERIQLSGEPSASPRLPLSEHIMHTEKQSVAGQWRALTRKFAIDD